MAAPSSFEIACHPKLVFSGIFLRENATEHEQLRRAAFVDRCHRLVDQFVPVCKSGPVCCSWSAACAAASLAVNNRKGEQDT